MMIDDAFPKMYLEQKAQIISTTTKTITISQSNKSFKDMFSVKNADNLPPHKDHDHAVNLDDEK